MVGQTISHYRILEKLGGGGMGVVYGAEDARLDRFVALKFLPDGLSHDAQALERFRHEAKASSAMNHPNTMKHAIAGRKMQLETRLTTAIDVADGLGAAHRKGIENSGRQTFFTERGHRLLFSQAHFRKTVRGLDPRANTALIRPSCAKTPD